MAADGGLPFASLPGLGDRELEGFPAERCPEQMPDLARHFSITADVLKEEPALYDAMRSRQTPMGVTFAKCIKTGMDNRGHPMIKTLGQVRVGLFAERRCCCCFKGEEELKGST